MSLSLPKMMCTSLISKCQTEARLMNHGTLFFNFNSPNRHFHFQFQLVPSPFPFPDSSSSCFFQFLCSPNNGGNRRQVEAQFRLACGEIDGGRAQWSSAYYYSPSLDRPFFAMDGGCSTWNVILSCFYSHFSAFH